MNLSRNFLKNGFVSYWNRNECIFSRHRPVGVGRFQRRTTNTSSEDVDLEIVGFDESEILPLEKKNRSIRNLLYPERNEDVFGKLKESVSVQNVFDALRELRVEADEDEDRRAWVQGVLVLYDLQRIYSNEYLERLPRSAVPFFDGAVRRYVDEIGRHECFRKLTEAIGNWAAKMTPEEIGCCGTFLLEMGVPRDGPAMNSLLTAAIDRLRDGSAVCDAETLERMSRFLGDDLHLRFAIASGRILPHLLRGLESCESADEFEKLTVALSNVDFLVTDPLISIYKSKLNELIDKNVIDGSHQNAILRAMSFLNFFSRSRRNAKEYEKLCHLIADGIKEMNVYQLLLLHKIFLYYMEPASVMSSIVERAGRLLETVKNEESRSAELKMANLMFCQALMVDQSNKRNIEMYIHDLIDDSPLSEVSHFYSIVRALKNDNRKLSNLFWFKTLEYLKSSPMKEDFQLLRLCYKYLFFDSGIKQNYRYFPIEKYLIRRLSWHFNNSDICHIPWKLSRLIMFLIAFSSSFDSQNYNFYLQNIVNKLENIAQQLNFIDTLLLSKSLNFVMKINTNRQLSPGMGQIFLKMDGIIQQSSEKLLKTENLSLIELNILFKIQTNCLNYNTANLYEILKHFDECNFEVTSKLLRDSSYCMYTSLHGTKAFFKMLCDYLETKNCNLMGDTLHKIIYLLFISGYEPETHEFLKYSLDIIERDKEQLNALLFMQLCEALCYYNNLSSDLVKYIFSIEFMERLDAEIESCHSKQIYPDRLRRQLMYLNRSVCIDTPEHSVPWFHQKYVNEIMSKSSTQQSSFFKDVYENLKRALNSDLIELFHYTPYGYRVDFCFNLDKNGHLTRESSDDGRKFAIVLLEKQSFFSMLEGINLPDGTKTFSINLQKKGRTQMRTRHLELLNYNVIEISTFLWHSMHMCESNAKVNYIKQQLIDKSINL